MYRLKEIEQTYQPNTMRGLWIMTWINNYKKLYLTNIEETIGEI